MDGLQKLRMITYLTGMPIGFYNGLATYLGDALKAKVTVDEVAGCSGPTTVGRDPLSRREADLAFLSSPSYLWLKNIKPSPVELLGAAPVFQDSRYGGRPETFCEIVVPDDGSFDTFEDLEGCLWGYTDLQSLTGYYGVLRKLESLQSEHFFSGNLGTGSEQQSLKLLAEGELDMAPIDANMLRIARRENPELQTERRFSNPLDPTPFSRLWFGRVYRSKPKEPSKRHLKMGSRLEGRALLDPWGCSGFAAPDEADYSSEKLLAITDPKTNGMRICFQP